MIDVSRWLVEQGLGQHVETFAKNGIAGDVLRDLPDPDLKELGLNLGDRKRLLRAIAALDTGLARHREQAAEALESLCTEQRLHFPLWIGMARSFCWAQSVASHPDQGSEVMGASSARLPGNRRSALPTVGAVGEGTCRRGPPLLAPIYAWFCEGFDTQDLQEARALLEALS